VKERLFISNPRIEIPIGEIDDEIDENDHYGDEKNDPLDDREIPLADGFKDQPPNSGQMEYIFNDNRACKKVPRLKADDRNHGNEGVSEGMLVDHHSFRYPLASGRPDIILSQNLKHGGPGHSGKNCGPYQPQRDGRENKGLQPFHRSHRPGLEPTCGEPMQADGK
jgi:hypothetical protein